MRRSSKKTALVLGAGGFIGSHLVQRLTDEGFRVRGVDLKHPEYDQSQAEEFFIGDLRDPVFCQRVIDRSFDEVYQVAADMGGAGYIFTGQNDAEIMRNSALINLQTVHFCTTAAVKKLFFSSSACVYPLYNQQTTDQPTCSEDSVYPAQPDSEYGWEKIFSERLYLAYHRNHGLNVKIARLHNVFGPRGAWNDGKEKAPAAICRKVAAAQDGGEIVIWGDGQQTRSFLYIDECLDGIRRFMNSEHFHGPVNIGSDEMVTINQLVSLVMKISGKTLRVKHIAGPLGVRGRNSDNRLVKRELGWEPAHVLYDGLRITYRWVAQHVRQSVARSGGVSAIS